MALSQLYVGDFKLGELLPVPLLAPVIAATLELEDGDFIVFAVANDLGHDLGAFDHRQAGTDLLPVAGEQDVIECHLRSRLAFEQRNSDGNTLFRAELLTSGFENRV